MKSNITIEGLRKIDYKVMVLHNGDITTIFLTNTEGMTTMGQSACHIGDSYNRKLGNKIALGRALKALNDQDYLHHFNPKDYITK